MYRFPYFCIQFQMSLNFEIIRLFDDTFTLFHFFVLRATINKLIIVMNLSGKERKGLSFCRRCIAEKYIDAFNRIACGDWDEITGIMTD